MGFLLYLIIVVAFFAVVMGFLGHDILIILPVLIVMAIVVAILRVIIIRKKNSY